VVQSQPQVFEQLTPISELFPPQVFEQLTPISELFPQVSLRMSQCDESWTPVDV
jgi:hypothetical protein